MNSSNLTTWRPDLVYSRDGFNSKLALVSDAAGRVASSDSAGDVVELNNRALLPGLVNGHSHAFQRVIRGRTEYRTVHEKDSFWTWREMMYSAAERLAPEDIYDASRMAFLEMALSGITSVGEFHYLHHAADGTPYDDPNLLAKEVVRAARDVGLRIALLRVAYARSGHQIKPNPRQRRFVESDPDRFLKHVDQLSHDLTRDYDDAVGVGIAPHSVRAVPLHYLRKIIGEASDREMPVHMHVAEQPAEVSACIVEYGRSPVAFLATEGLLSERFTAVHAIHVTPKAVRLLAEAGSIVCACPTTERNLGDGIVPIDSYFIEGVPVSLGSDSHTQIDLLEDARELEYHLRLQKLERAVLDLEISQPDSRTSALAQRLFECASVNGAESIKAPGGRLEPGQAADFFTVDLNDPSIAGTSTDDLLPAIVFSLSKTAVRDVVVGGKRIIEAGRHAKQEEIVENFRKLQKRLWG